MKGYAKTPAFDLRACKRADVAHLFAEHHAYRSAGRVCTYAFAVFEDDAPVAAFLWQPPPPAAARSVCAALPIGVLSLSRMVAVPREQRRLQHISKPLREQMLRRIDRTRWPVLVTYSDESVGHTGHVYKCSGWTPTARNLAVTHTRDGARVSRYSNGAGADVAETVRAKAWIQRWEHWHTNEPRALFDAHWDRVTTGRVWRSGTPAFTYVRREDAA